MDPVAQIVVENLSKIYQRGRRGNVTALQDLSLTIEDRELMVLVGPSGCGKTTTLRLLAGLEEPTAGTIKLDGSVINKLKPGERDIAMVFQHGALYPHMTSFDNMAFGLIVRRFPKNEIKSRVLETAE